MLDIFLLIIIITSLIFLVAIVHVGFTEISKSLNDLYTLYFDELTIHDDDIDLDFKER